MPADTSTLDPLFKDVYGPGIKNQMPDEVPLLKSFETDAETAQFQGREAVVAVKVNRNRGGYANVEGGAAPTAGNVQIENFRIPIRYQHYAIRATIPAMKASQSNKGAFARVWQLEMDELMDSIKYNRLFHLWGDGRGVRALINGEPSTGTTVTLDAPGGVAGANHGNRFLNVNDEIVAINPLSGLLRAGGTRRVTAVAADGTTATVAAAIDSAWADNDYIVKAYGTDASVTLANTEWQHAPMGMLGMVDNGTYVNTYFNLSRTTYPILQSTRIASVGSLSADIVQRALDVAMQIGSASIKEHWVHPDTRRAYLTLMENDRRYTNQYLMNPNAGTNIASGQYDDSLGFGPGKIKVDPHAPYGMWFGLDPRSAVRYVLPGDNEWVSESGAVMRWVSGTADTFEAFYRVFDNFCLLRPNQSFRLEGITTSFVIAHVI